MPPTHRLLFAGQPLPGTDPIELRKALTERLKLTEEKADLIFSGKPVSLRKFSDAREAEHYRARFTEIGAKVWVEAIAASEPPKPAADRQPPTPAPGPAATPSAEEIDCPNCGERQPKRTLCRQCSADMPRVLAARRQAEEEAREARVQARETAAGPLARTAEATLTDETPPLVGWGLGGRIGRVTYLLGNLAMSAIAVPIAILSLKLGSFVAMGVLLLLVAIACLRITALRCNDVGWSKWLTLIQLIPYVGAAFSFILLVVPGERNRNAEGLPTPIAGLALVAFSLVIAIGSVFSLRKDLGPMLMTLAAQGQFSPAAGQGSDEDMDEYQVVLYSDNSCSDCGIRRKELEKAGIPYLELSLDNNPAAHARLQQAVFRSRMDGQTICTPILEVNGIVLPNGTGVAEAQALLQVGG